EHIINFLSAIRKDKPLSLNSEIEEGYKSTLLCHLGNISYRTGRTLNCDPSNGHILDDKEAMGLWGRDYDKAFEPKV
ncbi:MAG: gfo/Idh/MocA family oxidoreductase, partial [Pirellulaceae bacterium]